MSVTRTICKSLWAAVIVLTLAACGGSPTSPSFGSHVVKLEDFFLILSQARPAGGPSYIVCGGINTESHTQEIVLESMSVQLRDASGQTFYTASVTSFNHRLAPGPHFMGGCWGGVDDPDPARGPAASALVRVTYSPGGGSSRSVETSATVG